MQTAVSGCSGDSETQDVFFDCRVDFGCFFILHILLLASISVSMSNNCRIFWRKDTRGENEAHVTERSCKNFLCT